MEAQQIADPATGIIALEVTLKDDGDCIKDMP